MGGVGQPEPCSELCLWYGEAISDLFYKWKTGKEFLNNRERKINAGLTTRTTTFLSVWTTVNPFQINHRNRAFELLSHHLIWSNLWMWRWKVNPQGHLLSFIFSVWTHCLACPLLTCLLLSHNTDAGLHLTLQRMCLFEQQLPIQRCLQVSFSISSPLLATLLSMIYELQT